MTFSRFGFSSSGTTSPYVAPPAASRSGGGIQPQSAPRAQRGFPERIPPSGAEGALMNAAEFATQALPSTIERPLAIPNVIGRFALGRHPATGVQEDDGDGPLNQLLAGIGSVGRGGPVSVEGILNVAGEALQRSGTFFGALHNSTDANALRYITENHLDPNSIMPGMKQGGFLGFGQSDMTVSQYLEQLNNRGFFDGMDPEGNPIKLTAEDLIRKMDDAGPLGQFQFGDKMMGESALGDLAVRLVTDPTNWVFGLGLVGKAAKVVGLTKQLQKISTVARWGAAPSLVGQAGNDLRGVGYLDDMVSLGVRSSEVTSHSAAGLSIAAGNAASGTLKGLGYALKQVYLPGRGSLGLRYARGAAIQQLGLLGIEQASGIASQAFDPTGGQVDESGNVIHSGFFSTVHDASEAMLDDHPLSGNQLFVVATMFGTPIHEGIRSAKAPIRASLRRAFGGGDGPLWARSGYAEGASGRASEELLYKKLGSPEGSFDEVSGKFDLSKADVAEGKRQFAILMDYLNLHHAFNRAAADPAFVLQAKSMDHLIGSADPMIDTVRGYADELVAAGKITEKDRLRIFEEWGNDHVTSYIDGDGIPQTISQPGGWNLPPDALLNQWLEWSRGNEQLVQTFGSMRQAILGRGQNMTREGMDSLIAIVERATTDGVIPANIVQGVLLKRPAMFTDLRIPRNSAEYFASLMNRGVASGTGVHGAGQGLYDAGELLGHLRAVRDKVPTGAELFHEGSDLEANAIDDTTMAGQGGPVGARGVNKLWTQKEIEAHRVRSTTEGRQLVKEIKTGEDIFKQRWTKRGNYRPAETARKSAPSIMDYTRKNGGGSFDPVTGKFDDTTIGYGVGAVEDTFAYVDQGDTAALADAAERIAREYPGNNVGTWINPDTGRIEVDPSTVIFDLKEAMALAVKNNQKAIRDLSTGTDIRNPAYKEKPLPAPRDVPEPNKLKANPAVRKVADAYNKEHGLPPVRKGEYFKLDDDFSQRTAEAFEALPKESILAKPAYDAFAKETLEQWDALQKAGFKFEPWEGGAPVADSIAALDRAPSARLEPDWRSDGLGVTRELTINGTHYPAKFPKESTPNGLEAKQYETGEGPGLGVMAYGPDGKAAGFFSGLLEGKDAGAFKIVVDPAVTRKGIGTRLLDEAEKAGFDIRGSIGKNSFTGEGRALLRAWLEKRAPKEQPYANSAEMRADVAKKHLWFFTGGEPHPFLNGKAPGYDLTYNDIFRAVHDVMTHAQEGYQFGPRGELNAAIKHSQMYSPLARKAMLTETHGQNSWVNFHEKAAANKEKPGTVYSEQKGALLPDQIINEFEDRFVSAKPVGPEPIDLEGVRVQELSAIQEKKARLLELKTHLLNLKARAAEIGVVPLHYTYHERTGKLSVDGDDLARIREQTKWVRDNMPEHEIKKPPTPYLPWDAADSVAGAIYTQRSNLARALFDYGPLAKITQFLDYMVEPVKASSRVRDAHRMMYSQMMRLGASEDEVTNFIAELARRRHEAGSLGPMKISVARYENSLLTSQIQQAGESVFGASTVGAVTSAGNVAFLKNLERDYGGQFYRLVDRSANSLVRKGEIAMLAGEKGLSGKHLLARAFAQGYDAFQHVPVVHGVSRFVDKVGYPFYRFYLSLRWQTMNLLENDMLGVMQDGAKASRFSPLTTGVAGDRAYELAQARRFGRRVDPRLTGEAEPAYPGIPDEIIPETGAFTGRFLEPVARRQFDIRAKETLSQMLDELPIKSPEAQWMIEHFGPLKDTWSKEIENMWLDWDGNGVRPTLDKEVASVAAGDRWTPQERQEMQPFLLRLGERQAQAYDDIAKIQLGNTERSRLERALNSYWLYWPLSYQIKTLKWMVDVMSNRAFGRQTNLGGTYLLEHAREIYLEQMQTNPQFRDEMDSNPTLLLAVSMMFPAVPWDQGVSLSRIPRYIGGNVLHLWPEYAGLNNPADYAQKSLELGARYDTELASRIFGEVGMGEQPDDTSGTVQPYR